MYDDNFDNEASSSCYLEIDNDWVDEVFTDDDSYIEEVDNTIWIESLIRDIDLGD